MTDTEADLSTIAHLDFEIRCDIRLQPTLVDPLGGRVKGGPMPGPCGKPAVFDARCRACGKAAPICADHVEAMKREAFMVCGKCLHVAPGGVLFEFIPIGSR